MKYHPLFHISLNHTYYPDLGCSDFLLTPDAKGEKIIRENRLLLNYFTNGLSVLTATDKLITDIVFSFQLRLRNSNFHHFTELPAIDTPLVYVNSSKGYNLQANTENSAPQLPTGAFGLIILNNVASYKEAPTFSLSFESKKVYWKYIVVTDEDVDALRIEQAGTMDKDLKIEFKSSSLSIGNVDNSLLTLLDQDYPHAKTAIIQSTKPVAFFKGGRRNIQLKKDNLVLVEHLPNPRPEEGGIKVIKYLKNQKK